LDTQFVGHAFEGKPPEFFRDWRFLFVGLRWWVAKMRGRAGGNWKVAWPALPVAWTDSV
jgi:hypothetical protein